MAIATVAVSAASAGVNYVAQSQQAEAQAQAENQRYAETERYRKENAESAQRAFAENAAQLRIGQSQEAVVRSEEAQRIDRERRTARGTLLASARTSSLGLDMLLQDVGRGAGRAISGLNTQALFDDQQTEQEITGARMQTLDAINSVRPYVRNPVSQPSKLGLAVDLAGAGLSGANTYFAVKKAA